MNHKELKSLRFQLGQFLEGVNYSAPELYSELENLIEKKYWDGTLSNQDLLVKFKNYINKFNLRNSMVENPYKYLEAIDKEILSRKRRVSISEVKTYESCKLKHALRYDMKLYPKYESNKNLRTGSLVHDAIEQLYEIGYTATEEDVEYLCSEMIVNTTDMSEEEKGQVTIDLAIARSLFRAYYYILFLNEQSRGLTIEKGFAEKWYNSPIYSESGRKSHKFEFFSKVDGLFSHVDGKKYLHEIKTKSQFGEAEIDALKLDDQVTSYFFNLTENEVDLGGVVYTVLKKPGLKQSKISWYEIKYYDDVVATATLKSDANAKVKELKAENPDKEYVISDKLERLETPEELAERIEKTVGEDMEKYAVREIIHREPSQVEGFKRKLTKVVKEISRNNIKTAYPQPSQFNMLCGMCDYREVCKNWYNVETRNELIKANYVTKEDLAMEKIREDAEEKIIF